MNETEKRLGLKDGKKQEVLDFLADVTGWNREDGLLELFAAPFSQDKVVPLWGTKDATTKHFNGGSDGLIKFIQRHYKTSHIHFNTSLKKKTHYTKSPEKNTKLVNCFWVDVDDPSLSLDDIEGLIPSEYFPTYVINSGNGLYLIWILQDPYHNNFKEWKYNEDRLVTVLDGDHEAKGLTQLLKIPYTLNFKNELNGQDVLADPPKIVTIIHKSERRYNPSDLKKLCDLIAPEETLENLSESDKRPVKQGSLPVCIGALFEGKAEVKPGYRHAANFVGAIAGFQLGLDETEASEKLLYTRTSPGDARQVVNNTYRILTSHPNKYGLGCRKPISRLRKLVEGVVLPCSGENECPIFKKIDWPDDRINRKVTFSEIQSAIHSYLRFEENADYIIDLTLAGAMSLQFDQPVWIMIIAPSSSGKTEILRLFKRVLRFHYLFNITPKTLFSGHPKAKGGFIPREIGEAGILCFPDFTTVLSARPDDRKGILNQLRVAYDGLAGRGTGVDEGEMPNWTGKIAFIGGVTNAIERFKSKMTDLGERFIYYKHPTPQFDESYFAVKDDQIEETRDQISYLIRDFIATKSPAVKGYTIDQVTEKWIVKMAQLISQGRAAVDRDGYTKDITYVHEPEGIWRLRGELRILYRCLLCIHEGNVIRPLEILGGIVKSSIPELRAKIVDALLNSEKPTPTTRIATQIGLPTNSTRHVLQEMAAHQMIIRIKPDEGAKNVDRWELSWEFKELWQNVFIPF